MFLAIKKLFFSGKFGRAEQGGEKLVLHTSLPPWPPLEGKLKAFAADISFSRQSFPRDSAEKPFGSWG